MFLRNDCRAELNFLLVNILHFINFTISNMLAEKKWMILYCLFTTASSSLHELLPAGNIFDAEE